MSILANSEQIQIVIIHPTPIIRLGIARALERQFSPAKIMSYANLSEAPATPLRHSTTPVAMIDANEWALHAPPLFSLAQHVGLITCTGSEPSCKLLRNRGFQGSISIEASPEEFLAMSNAMISGQDYFPATPHHAQLGISSLSQRQLEILELMTRGLLNKQIAWELGLTEGTVKSHVSAILEKLNCNRRTQAITAFMKSIGLGGRLVMA